LTDWKPLTSSLP